MQCKWSERVKEDAMGGGNVARIMEQLSLMFGRTKLTGKN